MEQNCLGSLSLGFEFLWNRLRQIAAVKLTIEVQTGAAIDAIHLGDTLKTVWPEQAPPLILSIQNSVLLQDILERGRPDIGSVVLDQDLLQQAAWLPRLQHAEKRGISLIGRIAPGQGVAVDGTPLLHRQLLNFTPQEAQEALRISLKKHQAGDGDRKNLWHSPALAGQVYESVWSRSLMEHLLDQENAWAVVGWPQDDVLLAYRGQAIGPSQQIIVRLIEAIETDASLKLLEQLLGQDPILTFRFLRFINSPAFGLETKTASLYRGLMLLGDTQLRSWLLEQLPMANSDLNLNPIRVSLVNRAHLMEQLLEPGEDEELRREIYLCGLLSQIDLLLGQKLGQVLHQLPLPDRILSALLKNSGPYLPFLKLAQALESGASHELRKLCKTYKLPSDEVNRATLLTLAKVQTPAVLGRLFV